MECDVMCVVYTAENKLKDLVALSSAQSAVSAAAAASLPRPNVGPDAHAALELLDLVCALLCCALLCAVLCCAL